jgi:hypothetical protein
MRMIELLQIHALVRTARVLTFLGGVAERFSVAWSQARADR